MSPALAGRFLTTVPPGKSWGHMDFWRKAKEGITERVSFFWRMNRSPLVLQTEGLAWQRHQGVKQQCVLGTRSS